MKNTITTLTLFAILGSKTMAQNFKAQFADLTAKKDTAAQARLLVEWERTGSENPDLYIAYFNYYIAKSRSDVLHFGTQQAGENHLN